MIVMTIASTPSLKASSLPLLMREPIPSRREYPAVSTANSSPEPSSPVEIESFLADYPPRIARQAQALRRMVLKAVPSAIERLRPGWRLIGYDLPISRHGTYFAWVWPETEHVHVGWQAGTLMNDPNHVLRGAHLKLKKVRYLTFEPGEKITPKVVIDLTREAARISSMSRGERQLLSMSMSPSDFDQASV